MCVTEREREREGGGETEKERGRERKIDQESKSKRDRHGKKVCPVGKKLDQLDVNKHLLLILNP